MPITAINRYFVGDPNLVGIVTTDDLGTITASGYIGSQSLEIQALQNGEFEWSPTDIALINHEGGAGMFLYSVADDLLIPTSPEAQDAMRTDVVNNMTPDGVIYFDKSIYTPSGSTFTTNTQSGTLSLGTLNLTAGSTAVYTMINPLLSSLALLMLQVRSANGNMLLATVSGSSIGTWNLTVRNTSGSTFNDDAYIFYLII